MNLQNPIFGVGTTGNYLTIKKLLLIPGLEFRFSDSFESDDGGLPSIILD